MAKGIGLSHGKPTGAVMQHDITTSRPGNVQPTAKSAAVPKVGTDAHYRATSDMNTLREAEMVKADQARHNMAKALISQHIQSLQGLVGNETHTGSMAKKKGVN